MKKTILFLAVSFALMGCEESKTYKVKYVVYYTNTQIDTVNAMCNCGLTPYIFSYEGTNRFECWGGQCLIATTAPIKILSCEQIQTKP